jgi:TRAP-type C4-dicarboxylate transport system substrate-binding protein
MKYSLFVGVAAALALTSWAGASRADPPVVLRIANVSPQGTPRARAFSQYGGRGSAETGGAVKMKWYWGATVGDEVEVNDRLLFILCTMAVDAQAPSVRRRHCMVHRPVARLLRDK